MLKVIHGRKKTEDIERVSLEKTCKNSCSLFNDELQTCPIFKGLDYEDPNMVKRCLDFTDIEETEKLYEPSAGPETFVTLIEEDFSVSGNLDFFFELNGRNRMATKDEYPSMPAGSQPGNSELRWHISSDRSYGCWIKNLSKNFLAAIPNNRESALAGWAENIYKSPIPLHDHNASESLRTRMCWYVDENGWGQYAVLLADDIRFLTYPKPDNWK